MTENINTVIESFLNTIKKDQAICLLMAYNGMFAMIEDVNNQEYLPVWENEDIAKKNITDDWKDYNIEKMPLNEFVNWLDELYADEIMIAIYLADKNVITLNPNELKKLLKK